MHRSEISLIESMEVFPDENSALKSFEFIKWDDSVAVCHRCGGINTFEVASGNPLPYRCRDCRDYFSFRHGTLLEGSHAPPRSQLRLWYAKQDDSFASRKSPLLKVGDDLGKLTSNFGYRGYFIRRISKPLRENTYRREFVNEVAVIGKGNIADLEGIFEEQLYWLIDIDFRKRNRLAPQEINCLSLIFIDRVDNYVQSDDIIRCIFEEKLRQVCREQLNCESTEEEITAVQSYYFAQTGKVEYNDNKRSIRSKQKLFDLIMKQNEELLRIVNPVGFIFSLFALDAEWDNPKVFKIATPNHSYSEYKKQQEIDRGRRISINQEGQRVCDSDDCPEGEEINQLTIVPNETDETFVGQHQSEFKEIYGTDASGAKTRHKKKCTHPRKRLVNRNDAIYNKDSFREFWRRLSLHNDYTIVIDENAVVTRATEALNAPKIEHYTVEVAISCIERLEPNFVSYADTIETPNWGPYDRVEFDSNFERNLAESVENDDEVVCFLKHPAFHQIASPISPYNPDFGVVLRRRYLQDSAEAEFYFVGETEGTNELADKKAFRESEVYKIKCVMKHLDTLGGDVHVSYEASVTEYSVFKTRAKGVSHA